MSRTADTQGFCKHCIKVAKHLTLLHDRNKFCSSVIADLLTRTAKHVAEVLQHATAKEDELKKAKEEACISDSAAALWEHRYLENYQSAKAELTGANESYSRCRADLDSATAQIKGLKQALEGVRVDLDVAHREAIVTGNHSCRSPLYC